MRMIVIGTDTHKRTHTCGAVDAFTAAARGELTAPARPGSFGMLLRWARALDAERVWAIEDCRHVSGAFERFLIARGERIVRVAPKHMAGARRSSRERGKSDSIDAFSVARAALKEGIENLPGAHLDGAALDIRLLVDHREDLIAARTADQQRLRWHLHDLWRRPPACTRRAGRILTPLTGRHRAPHDFRDSLAWREQRCCLCLYLAVRTRTSRVLL